jgi:hypothetical protein
MDKSIPGNWNDLTLKEIPDKGSVNFEVDFEAQQPPVMYFSTRGPKLMTISLQSMG